MRKERIGIVIVMLIAFVEIVWIRLTYQNYLQAHTEYLTPFLVFVVGVSFMLLVPEKPGYRNRRRAVKILLQFIVIIVPLIYISFQSSNLGLHGVNLYKLLW